VLKVAVNNVTFNTLEEILEEAWSFERSKVRWKIEREKKKASFTGRGIRDQANWRELQF
jgi:hypothetical protein